MPLEKKNVPYRRQAGHCEGSAGVQVGVDTPEECPYERRVPARGISQQEE